MSRRIVTAREQFERFAEYDDRHPDLLDALARFGVAHTSCGRCLTGRKTAASFDDPSGWTYHKSFEPSQIARQGASAYTGMMGLPDPHNGSIDYLNARRTPESVKAVGHAYDSMPNHDPRALKHFDAMRDEIGKQHDFMTNKLGIQTQTVNHDPYSDVHEMMDDINNNHRLQVLGTHVTGGHPYFDDATNDKFRAVHDFFGHAATGRSFDRHGEQAAYLAHAQMFSPQARPALASETRGQNSSLILNGGFQPQKTSIMPAQFWSGNGMLHVAFEHDMNVDRQLSKARARAQEAYQRGDHELGDYLTGLQEVFRRDVAAGRPESWGSHYMPMAQEEFGDERVGRNWYTAGSDEDFDRALTQQLDQHGGSTFKERPGDGPTSGYMVSQTPDHKLPIETFHPSQVREVRDQNRGKLGPDEYNGVWKEPDAVYHEISKNHPDYNDAAKDAYDRDQIAFYDLNHDTDIDTAGTQYNGQPGIWLARRWYQ